MLNDIQKHILSVVADMASIPDGAVNIRSDGKKAYRHNTENIEITSKTDKDGIDIRIKPFTKHEDVHIPVVLTASGMHDMVYNDFFVGEGAEVRIVAGCGIHNCGDCDSQHDGIQTFYVGKNEKAPARASFRAASPRSAPRRSSIRACRATPPASGMFPATPSSWARRRFAPSRRSPATMWTRRSSTRPPSGALRANRS